LRWGEKKTRMMPLPEFQKKCDDMSIRLVTPNGQTDRQTDRQRDRQTDGRTELVKQHRALHHCVLTRDKIGSVFTELFKQVKPGRF